MDFWEQKFVRNVQNDKKNQATLTTLGWHVIVIWECQIHKNFEETMSAVQDELTKIRSGRT
jgi:DNA mismatch endonuclease (patch repair protein)